MDQLAVASLADSKNYEGSNGTNTATKADNDAAKGDKKPVSDNESAHTLSDLKAKKGRRNKEDRDFPVEPVVIQIIKKPRTYMNHSYRDFSRVPRESDDEDIPTEIDKMSFNQKVHHMVSQKDFSNWIAWQPHGRAFRVVVPKKLEQAKVLQKYFGHNRYSSFLRQLSNHGYKHLTQGPDRNCFYHEFMLRGLPHLTKYMPEPKDARRLIPDPDNEPDFHGITLKYPLPDDPGYAKRKRHEETSSTTAGQARTFSEVDWIQNQAPDAKRQVLGGHSEGFLGMNAPLPNSSLVQQSPMQDNTLLKFQDLMQQNNQLIAAVALQASLNRGQGTMEAFQGVPQPGNNAPSAADALAAVLRSRSSGFGGF